MRTNKLQITRPQHSDADVIASNLRPEDAADAEAWGLGEDLPRLLKSTMDRCPHTWTVLGPRKVPVAVGGVDDLGGGRASVWLLGTPELLEHKREFLRRIRPTLDRLNGEWPTLVATIHSHNKIHRRWVRWAGFTELGDLSGKGGREIPLTMIERRKRK